MYFTFFFLIVSRDQLQFPPASELNNRIRRIIASYQRNFKNEEMKMTQKAKQIVRREKIETIDVELERTKLRALLSRNHSVHPSFIQQLMDNHMLKDESDRSPPETSIFLQSKQRSSPAHRQQGRSSSSPRLAQAQAQALSTHSLELMLAQAAQAQALSSGLSKSRPSNLINSDAEKKVRKRKLVDSLQPPSPSLDKKRRKLDSIVKDNCTAKVQTTALFGSPSLSSRGPKASTSSDDKSLGLNLPRSSGIPMFDSLDPKTAASLSGASRNLKNNPLAGLDPKNPLSMFGGFPGLEALGGLGGFGALGNMVPLFSKMAEFNNAAKIGTASSLATPQFSENADAAAACSLFPLFNTNLLNGVPELGGMRPFALPAGIPSWFGQTQITQQRSTTRPKKPFPRTK